MIPLKWKCDNMKCSWYWKGVCKRLNMNEKCIDPKQKIKPTK